MVLRWSSIQRIYSNTTRPGCSNKFLEIPAALNIKISLIHHLFLILNHLALSFANQWNIIYRQKQYIVCYKKCYKVFLFWESGRYLQLRTEPFNKKYKIMLSMTWVKVISIIHITSNQRCIPFFPIFKY